MKRSDSIGLNLGCGLAAAMVWLYAGQALAAPVSWPVGPGSLTGVWTPADIDRSMDRPAGRIKFTTIEGDPAPIRPEARAAVLAENAKAAADAAAGRPHPGLQSQCLPAGFPGMMFGSGLPHETIETPGQVTMLVEELSFFRIIRLNATHEKNPAPTLMGDSIGHWEGDTLVVDTIGLSKRTALPGGAPHSEQLHVVERYRRTSPDRVEILMTFEDPTIFTRPWTVVTHLKMEPTKRISDYYCANNRNPPKDGATTAVLQSSSQ